MKPRTLLQTSLLIGLVGLSLAKTAPADDPPRWRFTVRFSNDVHSQPFTGRAYVIFSAARKQPRQGPSWFQPESFISRDVENVKPGEPIVFDSNQSEGMLAYPKPLAQMDLTGYNAQAVLRFNPLVRKIGTGAGNGFSEPQQIAANPSRLTFDVGELVEAREFRESRWGKLLRVRSKLLSEFHNRDVYVQAGVILPASYYDQPHRRYPVIFSIPGFGGTHRSGQRNAPIAEQNRAGVEFLRVMLDPSCPLGHHVFADSANNGPVGAALTTELIPELDRAFRSVAKPGARFLTGHSSGGWSSLWLQVAYPDVFGGTWSTAPDPVDFRDFQRINLYRPDENMYVDAQGNARPLARRRKQVVLTYKGFADMEWTLGYGGQLHSFEAVFSPRGPDGKPKLLWNRKTGAINTDVAKSWEKYDIRLVLERNWKTLEPKLQGKIHVFMGDADTFYLDGATALLKESLETLSDDPVVEMHPGKDHGSLMTRQLLDRIRSEMVDSYLKNFPNATSE